MFKLLLIFLLFGIISVGTNAQTFPSLNVDYDRYAESDLATYKNKFSQKKDTIGLLYTYGVYLITEPITEKATLEALIFLLKNKDKIKLLPAKDKLKLNIIILRNYIGAEEPLLEQKLNEAQVILDQALLKGLDYLALEAFFLKYDLASGLEYQYFHSEEIPLFYEKYKNILKDHSSLGIQLNRLMGWYAQKNKDYLTALACFQTALQLAQKKEKINLAFEFMLFLAQTNRLNGDLNESIRLSKMVLDRLSIEKKASELIFPIWNLDLQRWAHEELANAYEIRGDKNATIFHWKAYDEKIKEIKELKKTSSESRADYLFNLEKEIENQTKIKNLQSEINQKNAKSNQLLKSIILLIIGIFVLSVVIVFIWYKQQRFKIRKLNEIKILEKQEEERELISMELHDNIGNTLIAIKNSIPKNIGEYTKITNSLNHVYGIVRTTSHTLSSSGLIEVGLIESCKDYIHLIDSNKIIDFKVYGTESKLLSHISKSIFRVIQEILQNAITHSKATLIMFSIYYEATKILISVEDNGVGFDSTQNNHGRGIANIKQRINFLNGNIEINTSLHHGVSIWLSIPF